MIFIWIDVPDHVQKQELAKMEGKEIGLENLADITNVKVILQMFGVTEKEKLMENGALDSVYNRIALKNI